MITPDMVEKVLHYLLRGVFVAHIVKCPLAEIFIIFPEQDLKGSDVALANFPYGKFIVQF